MEEALYWTQFQTVSFAVLLSGDFHSHLMIPKKFSENVRKKLPEKVAIRGPGAHGSNWEVQLTTINNATYIIGEGWKEFVNAYSLKEKDILIFKYKNNSYFKVSVFDRQSNWVENESSYFVKKPVTQKVDCENKQEGCSYARLESSPIVFSASNESGEQGRAEDKAEEGDQNPRKRDSRVRTSMEVVEDSEDEFEIAAKSRPLKMYREEDCEIRTPPQNAHDESRVHPETVGRGNGLKQLAFPRTVKDPRGSCTCPHIDSISEEKKARAKQRAHKEFTEDSFHMVMTCSLVHRRFRLSVPKGWTDQFMSGCNQNVILQLNGHEDKEWRLRYNFDKNRGLGVFISGWRQFVHDNALSLFDVCVFKLAGKKEGKACLDVKIFRVVEDEGDQPKSDVVMELAST